MIIIKKLEYNLSPFKSGMNQINSDLQCMFNMIVHMHGIRYSVISNYIKLMVYLHLNVPTDNWYCQLIDAWYKLVIIIIAK